MKKTILFFLLLQCILNFIFPAAIFANEKASVHSKTNLELLTCSGNPKLQEKRSLELRQLVAQDQKERRDISAWSNIDKVKMFKEDLKLRKRVGEIFAEGCLKSSGDYLNAALIFQHGDTPSHYYQVYIWAKQALELGAVQAKSMMALGIDRYLISHGKKQLFGSQYFSDSSMHGCHCREKTETNFPDSLRREYLGKTLDEYTNEMLTLFNNGKKCPIVECSKELKPTPRGTIPGLW